MDLVQKVQVLPALPATNCFWLMPRSREAPRIVGDLRQVVTKKKPAFRGLFPDEPLAALVGYTVLKVRMSRSLVSRRKIDPMTSNISATTMGYHGP
jgi:hypothetical protein